ncbi:uncharacterized protein TNCV_1284041 [Trichonephila clavipes]|uniref:Uncharacterized protein n=1 Tax=Trichonephila clavipes TaxID=2585209 RepID=A0A8X6VPK2_TRICX|nr:uncharacterized protein TNCV_1284041 [Trichonephila clavipes]
MKRKENFQWLPKELHQLKYEAISVLQGSVRLVKKTQERKSSTCYLLISKGVMSSSPVPLKTHRERERCTLNLLRAQTSSCWNGVVVKRGQLKYRPRQPWFKITRSISKSPRVAEQCDVNIHSLDHECSLKLQLLEQNMTALPTNNISVILVKSIFAFRPLLRSFTCQSF